jgi:hypothetical protein
MATEQTTLFINEGERSSRPEGACVNWESCRGYPPGHPETKNVMCDDCLDAARSAGRGHDC